MIRKKSLSPRIKSFLVFSLFGLAGLATFVWIKSRWLAYGAFFVLGVIGMVFSGRIFDRCATLDEKRADLEERNRNSF